MALWWLWFLQVALSNISSNPAVLPEDLLIDPYMLRKHQLPFSKTITGVCDVSPGIGEEGPAGLKGLYKIQQGFQHPRTTNHSGHPNRLLCIVYTHSSQHKTKLTAIAETYAPLCDGFWAVSNQTDPTLGAFRLPHYTEEESYHLMWNKVQAIWTAVRSSPLLFQNFDWFHIGGDDMYVVPRNLKAYLSTLSPQSPWSLGASIPDPRQPQRRFCSGGAGYTLNRRAVHALYRHIQAGHCPSKSPASDEDIRVGKCLGNAGIRCLDTNDDIVQVRYHSLDAQYHASWTPEKRALWHWEKLYYLHGIVANQSRLDQISSQSVSFHLDKGTVRSAAADRGIRRYHAILYRMCGAAFQEQVVERSAGATSVELYRKWKETPVSKQYSFS